MSKPTPEPPTPPQRRYMRTAALAEASGLTKSQIYRLVRAGKLRPYKPSGPTGPSYFTLDQLHKFMESSRRTRRSH